MKKLMLTFYGRCPEVASRELRTMIVHLGTREIPPGEYSFVEFFCDNPDCDCRRALLQVVSQAEPRRELLAINYGWESQEYYRRSMKWSAKAARELVKGSLDSLSPRPPYADMMLKLFRESSRGFFEVNGRSEISCGRWHDADAFSSEFSFEDVR